MSFTELEWWVKHWNHHSVEIYWAIGIGVVVGIPLAIWAAIYIETRSGKRLRRWVLSLWSNLNKIFVSDCNLLRPEVAGAIKSNCNKVSKELVARQVSKHNALTWNKKYIYTDTEKKYYFPRKLSLFPLLDGEMEDFCSEGCTCLFEKLKPNIDTSGNFRFLYLSKNTNEMFSLQLVGQHFGDKIISHSIRCDETRVTPRNLTFRYEKGESLEGVRVVLLESFVLVPDVLNKTVEWLQEQGATVEAVAVLFMGAEKFCTNNPCMIGQENVKIAYFVDMKITESLPQKSEGRPLKVLTYCKY